MSVEMLEMLGERLKYNWLRELGRMVKIRVRTSMFVFYSENKSEGKN